jgi:ATP-dependent Lon protease
LAASIIQINPNLPSEAGFALSNIEHPGFLVNFISSNLNATISEKQVMLAMSNLKQRATQLLTALHKEYQLLEIKQQIHSKVKTDIDKQQREYFLHQQMKTIQEELGTGASEEVLVIKKKAESLKWPESAKKVFAKEMAKMERMNPMVAEYSVQLNYLEFVTDLPWESYSDDSFDLKKAAKILDRDHYGLEKVKQRVLEHLAVLKRRGDMKAPIICLVGPPGVGKTSLGRSVAEALGRKYSRMSLGGVRDESEIRGHRRTYIGAMAGRLLQNLKKCGTSNPVFILDEIDKLSRDVHGDPSSALLEVLDPEQNQTFHDNYLDMDYDLSKVLFIATANDLGGIPRPLLDRMEIIRVPGYATEEKINIATKHLLPKQLEAHGMKGIDLKLSKKLLTHIVDSYTRESGVRSLERKIAAIVRRKLVHEDMQSEVAFDLSEDKLPAILGSPIPREQYDGNDKAGVVTGLAYTAVGGDVLYIESSISPGRGKLTLTGNLGGVMKESALLAMEYLKAQGSSLGIKPEWLDYWNVHIHVPEGAVPKDGPSAGVTMLTALASLFTQRKVKAQLAMTGEITLRGQVLAVGGIKEKVLAARRAGIKTVLLPDANRFDFEEINASYTKGLKVIYMKTLEDVLDAALSSLKVSKPIDLSAPSRNKQNRA